MGKKHCLFQCAITKESMLGYIKYDVEILEDTDLITWEEAIELWNKFKPRVIKQLEDGQSPEMVIWTGCKSNTDYRTDAYHVDQHTETENDEFVNRITKIIDPKHKNELEIL